MEHKSCLLELKDVDTSKRTAVIAHAVYGNIDLVGDISTKGMFNSSWSRKDAISFYMNHDGNRSPGSVQRTFEDDQKAYTEVKFGDWTEGNDALKMIDHGGVIRGASFGYNTEKKEFKEVKGRRVRVLQQVGHMETSLLTKQPANPLAGIVSMSKEAADAMLLELKENLAAMESFCRSTTASDDAIKSILTHVDEYKNIISKYDTASTPLITDGDASRNDNSTFRKNLLLTQILLEHGRN